MVELPPQQPTPNMKRTPILNGPAIAAAVTLLTSVVHSHAAVIINVQEVGNDVVATASGSIDLAALTFNVTLNPSNSAELSSFGGSLNLTSLRTGGVDRYTGASPIPFGPLIFTASTSSIGDAFGLSSAFIFVPSGYVSGEEISGSITFNNESIASLSVPPDTYVSNWGSGASADSLTINVIPEPSSALLSLLALAGLPLRRRR